LGIVLLSVAGWLGGTLVHRNQIGVDHRYANAGKWNEAYFKGQTGAIEVAAMDELKMNALKLLHIGEQRIVLGRTEKGYMAFSDHCTHRGASLADGVLICGTVQCPWHGSQFDVETGAVKEGPAKESIAIYKVEEREGKVFLML
jgi:nitrite reductase/ring-hydroxylating ferredoxin subunit